MRPGDRSNRWYLIADMCRFIKSISMMQPLTCPKKMHRDTRIGDPGILRLIRPPILLPSNDTYIIISGFWQLSADSLKDSRKIRCHVLDVGTSPLECARIAVSSHALTHSVNIITSARAITLLSNYVEDHTGLVECGQSMRPIGQFFNGAKTA